MLWYQDKFVSYYSAESKKGTFKEMVLTCECEKASECNHRRKQVQNYFGYVLLPYEHIAIAEFHTPDAKYKVDKIVAFRLVFGATILEEFPKLDEKRFLYS